MTYNLKVRLDGINDPDEDIEDSLFKVGLDNSTLYFQNSVAFLDVYEEGESEIKAISSIAKRIYKLVEIYPKIDGYALIKEE